MTKIYGFLILVVLCVGGFFGYKFYKGLKDGGLSVNQEKTTATATRIDSFKEIGQWEFLAVSDEELVDTTHTDEKKVLGFTVSKSTKELARVYSGTIHLGFNLKEDTKNNPDWIKVEGDTAVTVTLPKVHLLDNNILDEASSKSVIEKGQWTHNDRARLAAKAQRQIKARCLTPKNLKRAQDTAAGQVTALLKAMGFKEIDVQTES